MSQSFNVLTVNFWELQQILTFPIYLYIMWTVHFWLCIFSNIFPVIRMLRSPLRFYSVPSARAWFVTHIRKPNQHAPTITIWFHNKYESSQHQAIYFQFVNSGILYLYTLESCEINLYTVDIQCVSTLTYLISQFPLSTMLIHCRTDKYKMDKLKHTAYIICIAPGKTIWNLTPFRLPCLFLQWKSATAVEKNTHTHSLFVSRLPSESLG